MPYEGGLESNEHITMQAADRQRRAEERMAERQHQPAETPDRRPKWPWWAFWRGSEPSREQESADRP